MENAVVRLDLEVIIDFTVLANPRYRRLLSLNLANLERQQDAQHRHDYE
jgi:hypothetical protein